MKMDAIASHFRLRAHIDFLPSVLAPHDLLLIHAKHWPTLGDQQLVWNQRALVGKAPEGAMSKQAWEMRRDFEHWW